MWGEGVMEGRKGLARGCDRGGRLRESLGPMLLGASLVWGEVAHSDLLGTDLQSSHPARNTQHGAFRLHSSRAGPSPILPLLAAFRARAQVFPALTSSIVRKGGGGKAPDTKGACATVTFPPKSGGNGLRSMRVRAEALRV